jgi:hypothetical protein
MGDAFGALFSPASQTVWRRNLCKKLHRIVCAGSGKIDKPQRDVYGRWEEVEIKGMIKTVIRQGPGRISFVEGLHYGVPECLPHRPNWFTPRPLSSKRVCPPLGTKRGGGQHSLAGEGAGDQFGRLETAVRYNRKQDVSSLGLKKPQMNKA